MTPSLYSLSSFSQTLTPTWVFRHSQLYIRRCAQPTGIGVSISGSLQHKTVKYNFYHSSATLIKLKISDKARRTETLPHADPTTGTYLMNTLKGNEKTMQKFMQVY
jgi:hypothetical protein